MVPRPILCPSCGAHDTSTADAAGYHTCVYCGSRYRLSGSPGGRAERQSLRSVGWAIGIGLGVLGVAIAIFAWVGRANMHSAPDSLANTRPSNAVSVDGEGSSPSVVISKVDVEAPPKVETPPEVPATATFSFHRTKPSLNRSFYALGVITNTSTFTIDNPKVIAVLMRDDEEVSTHFGYSVFDHLEAGEQVPLSILVQDPEDYDRIDFEVVARKASYVAERAAGLAVMANEPKVTFADRWDFSGKISNEGHDAAEFVKVIVEGFDEEGKLLGLSTSYADARTMAPGSTSRWSMPSVAFARRPVRFSYSALGRVKR